MDRGSRIKQLRERKGIAQVDLARQVGISKQTLYKYENNLVRNIPPENVESLARALETTPQYLMGWIQSETSDELLDYYDDMSTQVISLFKEAGFFLLDVDYIGDPIFVFINNNGNTLAYYERDLVHKIETLKQSNKEITFASVCQDLHSVFSTEETKRIKSAIARHNNASNNKSAFRIPPELMIPAHVNIRPVTTKRLPVLSAVACGEPILMQEEREVYIDALTDIKADFVLIAKGDSMTGARIFDGDIVFIRSQPEVENGEIAVVAIGDEATLKRVFWYANKTLLVLRADNPDYPDMEFSGAELENIRIFGKAVAFQSEVK